MAEPDRSDNGVDDLPQTTAADVESAGRSCMAIILLAAVILLVVLIWIALTAFGVVR
jgi:cobalamin biosynthesis Mg chelatase CobN